ncbi:MAG: hypothetical protein J5676_10480 [Bacteroidaceae bacterium]|nr:hypothetical protein [Bacteroidaceae bacterium]
MNKIEFPRTSYDGTSLTKKDLEDWYLNEVKDTIKNKLNNKKNCFPNGNERSALDFMIKNIEDILNASPSELEKYTRNSDLSPNGLYRIRNVNNRWEMTDFGNNILDAFNYDNYRKTILKKLAKKLNVKTCPYCNMHYTLFAEGNNKKRLAKFQFDHFFDKSDYPFLSMSLYNLIPSCAVCNQGKSTGKVSLKFHPYDSAICDQFHFEVKNPQSLFSGAKLGKDQIDIKLIKDTCTQQELDVFDNTFNIKTLYSRHGDIAQEVFDKAYEEPYYLNPCNFNFLQGKSSEYLQRLWMGTYTEKSEIEKRPMTKYIQDLWKQASGNKK